MHSLNTSFLSSGLGQQLQNITKAVAFPFFLIATFLVLKRLWRRSHREAFMMVGLVALITAFLLDLSLIVGLANLLVGIAGNVFSWLGSL